MSKTVKIIMVIIGILVLLTIVYLVWGGTIRMAYANRLFHRGKYYDALKIYEDMAVDAPKSHYILHNRALGYYQQGDYKHAGDELQKATKILADERNKSNQLTGRYQYHLGNTLYKLGAKAQPGQVQGQGTNANNQEADPYRQALQSYQKAIEADPHDPDAKFNYELTLLHLQHPQSRQQQQKQQPQPEPSPKPNEDLLNAAKQEEKYLPPPPPRNETPVDKDW